MLKKMCGKAGCGMLLEIMTAFDPKRTLDRSAISYCVTCYLISDVIFYMEKKQNERKGI